MGNLRIMTNNVWCCWDNQPWWAERGLNCASDHRAAGFAQVYAELLPDLIGWQEGDYKFQLYVPLSLNEKGLRYKYLSVGGGVTPILFNKETLELVEASFCAYPKEVPGLDGIFSNGISKAYTAAVFRTKADGKMIVFANTHLCWLPKNPAHKGYSPYAGKARAYQIGLMIDCVEEYRKKYSNCPAVICGDFNDDYNSEAIKEAMARGFSHAHDIATDYADERDGCHYCFPDGYDNYENPKPFEEGIDHILVKGAPEGFVRRFERYTPEYYMPLSDHFPAYIDAEI